jgi:hypothetical protein
LSNNKGFIYETQPQTPTWQRKSDTGVFIYRPSYYQPGVNKRAYPEMWISSSAFPYHKQVIPQNCIAEIKKLSQLYSDRIPIACLLNN